ncbi:MAG TPA: D-aminoacyl-tRNA deacylase [Tepidisphaeraceae bacterium]|jgi:D-tyrosyl-tRNA(Tyr) deacylase|nr:D-aminoacyl-tRNA deacylase [Tepidisphaeraceae bacterium]
MIGIVQRVIEARVTVNGDVIGQIERGLVVLLSVHADDAPADVTWTASKLASLRIFPEGDKHYHLDVTEAGGSILLISNFTVAAATRQGRRPSLDAAAKGDAGQRLFDSVVSTLRDAGVRVETGRFGAEMLVHIINDGPATFIVDSRHSRG